MPDRRALYNMKWDPKDKFVQLVLLVEYRDGRLIFFDTNRWHGIPGEITKEDEEGFDFIRRYETSTKEELWRFDLVDLTYWKRIVRPVVDPHRYLPEFSSSEDLWEYYRKNYTSTY